MPSSQCTSAQMSFEPDDEWKQALKIRIETGLRSMVDEAKKQLNEDLTKRAVGAEERERLTANYLATFKNIRMLAEEQFRIGVERERQERRWAVGAPLDREWSEGMIKEQQAILDRIGKEKENKTSAPTPRSALIDRAAVLPSSPPPPPIRFQSPGEPVGSPPWPYNRKMEHVDGKSYASRPVGFERDEFAMHLDQRPAFQAERRIRAGSVTSMGSWKPPSTSNMTSSPGCPIPSPVYDPESVRRAARTPDPTRAGGMRRPSMTARPMVQEFWKPPIRTEEDLPTSRTPMVARRSGSVSSASVPSQFKTPSASTDPLDAPRGNSSGDRNVDREQANVRAAAQAWTTWDRPRWSDRPGYVPADDRSWHDTSIGSARAGGSRYVSPPPENPRRTAIMKEASSSQPGTSSHNWRSPSPSPQTTEVVARGWDTWQPRERFSSQGGAAQGRG